MRHASERPSPEQPEGRKQKHPCKAPLPRKATGEVQSRSARRGPSRSVSTPSREGEHPRCRRLSPGTRRRGRGGVDTQRTDIGGSRAASGVRTLHFATVSKDGSPPHSVAVTWLARESPRRNPGVQAVPEHDRANGVFGKLRVPCRARCRSLDRVVADTVALKSRHRAASRLGVCTSRRTDGGGTKPSPTTTEAAIGYQRPFDDGHRSDRR